jgi:hypothetical protein
MAPVILLVLRDVEGSLRFLVHPNLRSLAHPEDLEYIESLLQDFVERARLHEEVLFKQLCSLQVGPLVTQEVGQNLSEHPTMQKLASRFVQI